MVETITLIIVGIAGIAFFLYNRTRAKESLYHRTDKRFREELSIANITNDWRRRQSIQLQLLWFSVVKKVRSSSPLFQLESRDIEQELNELEETELRFPQPWSLVDMYCYPLAKTILASVGDLMVSKPSIYYKEEDLHVPREYIAKSVHFLTDYLNLEEPLYTIPDKPVLADLLGVINATILSEGLDASVIRENDLSQLQVIDWRSVDQWLVESARHAAKDQYDFAIACCERAASVDRYHKSIESVSGIIHLGKGEWLIEKGNFDEGVEVIRKSASLGNDEAKEWLHANNQL